MFVELCGSERVVPCETRYIKNIRRIKRRQLTNTLTYLLFVELCGSEGVIAYMAGPQSTVIADVVGVAVTPVDLKGCGV